MQSKYGKLMSVRDAAKAAGISQTTIKSYIDKGYMPSYLAGTVVSYRDLLKASFIAAEKHRLTSGKKSENYGKTK